MTTALTTRPTPKQKITPKAKAAAYQSVNPFNGKILKNIKPSNPAYREEFFGPVALFFRVKNEDEAVALANDSDFGLGGSVFTADVARGKRVASRIDTGMVFINHPTWTSADLPFGGIKNSGYGRELSSLGIQEFVNTKLIRVAGIDDPA